MKCERLAIGGVNVIACRGRARRARCSVKGCGRPASKLCDGPAAAGLTCDAKLCDACARPQAPDVDLCPICDEAAARADAGDVLNDEKGRP